MKKCLMFFAFLFAITVEAQKHTRYVPLGVVSGGMGTLLAYTITKDRNIALASGILSSIACSYLVRYKTDAITSLYTAGAGIATTAGITISLNRKKKSRECFRF